MLALALAACHDGGRQGASGPPPSLPPAADPPGYLGPTLALDAPARGAMLDGAGPLALAGRACDDVHAITSATLAGSALALTGSGSCRTFAAEVTPGVGLQVLRGEVVNDAGERGTLAQAVLVAPGFFDADGAGASAGSGLLVRLGPRFLDDGDRATPDDVATVVQTVLDAQDLDAEVGAQRIASPDANGDGQLDTKRYSCALYTVTNKRTGYVAWKDGPLTRGPITVDGLALEQGGVVARITVHALRVPFGVTGNVDSGCLGDAQDSVHGDVTVRALTLEAHAAVAAGAAGLPTLEVTSTSASLDGLDIDIALGRLVDWTGLGSLIGDGIESVVRGPIQAALRDGVRVAVDARLRRLLPAVAAVGGAIKLPPALGGGALALEAGLDLADFTPERALVGLRVRIRPPDGAGGALHAGARGAMRLGGGLPAEAALAGDALALGLADDALNQLLHAAWAAGALDVSRLALEGGVPGSPGVRAVVSVAPALPPVVMPRRDGSAGLELGWGELAFDVALEGPRGSAHVTGWLSIVIGLDGLGVDPATGTFRPAFAEAPEVTVELASVDWGDLPASRSLTEGLMAGILRAKLADLLGSAMGSAPLPAIDLGRLDPSLPSLRLGLSGPRDLRSAGYSVVAGGVAAVPR
ncbi:MAG: hypothetical protein QM704_26555 [Anaeromyxobacteraceae bacterium]